MVFFLLFLDSPEYNFGVRCMCTGSAGKGSLHRAEISTASLTLIALLINSLMVSEGASKHRVVAGEGAPGKRAMRCNAHSE